MELANQILIVDDDQALSDVLRDILEGESFEVRLASNSWQALDTLKVFPAKLILLDLKLPGMNGLEVLRQIQREYPLTQVVMISGHGTIAIAIEAIRLGAFDWMEKPLDKEQVITVAKNALGRGKVLREKYYKMDEAWARFGMIGSSSGMQKVFQLIERVASSDVTVIIRGDSGTGKELVARAIHQNGARSRKPFIHLNCAAIPDGLIESELFGYHKGAFTGAFTDQIGKFQASNEGTLFLDEIGDLSLSAQAKVLRAIEVGEIVRVGTTRTEKVNVRLISATHRDLKAMQSTGSFRMDLFHRITVIEIYIPPLKERKEDILPLTKHFMAFFSERHGIALKELDVQAFSVLLNHDWQGNVRELRNLIEKMLILSDSPIITANEVARLLQFPTFQTNGRQAGSFAEAKAYFEKSYLLHVLQTNSWNIAKTAEQIGMERSVLYKKIEKYELKKSQKEDN